LADGFWFIGAIVFWLKSLNVEKFIGSSVQLFIGSVVHWLKSLNVEKFIGSSVQLFIGSKSRH